MFDKPLNQNSQYYYNYNNTIKTLFDLSIIQKERIGDFLFLIGTILAFIAADQEEKPLIQKLSNLGTTSSTSDSLKTITIASWLFFAASIIFATTSYTRLREQESELPQNPSISTRRNFFGREISTLGNFIKVIGFGLVAIGDQIRVDNPEVESN